MSADDRERRQPDAVPPLAPVEPLGAREAPPSLGAVETWDWRSGTVFSGIGSTSSSGWEPTPYAGFGLSVPPPPAEPPPAAQPTIALPGAIAPEDA
ncbi:hypothetical protein GCM10009846_25040 [Agrococcus versicolor]|uniref:Uncharacterized protein n=1 Tax=Agrococcus versicolor TaxID=501482 RepID=A0ABN3AWC7_9MICO